MADGLRNHFSSTYFSEDLSVYHEEPEHDGGQESAPMPGAQDQFSKDDGPTLPDELPTLSSFDHAATDAISPIRGAPRKTSHVQNPSTVPVNITRLTRKRLRCGLVRPQSRSQEAKMIHAALEASILDS